MHSLAKMIDKITNIRVERFEREIKYFLIG